MNQENNEQTELLRNIWNEIKSVNQSVNAKIDATNSRLDTTNSRLDGVERELGRRIDTTNDRIDALRSEMIERMRESEIRLATATTELAGNVRTLTEIISAWRLEHRASIVRLESRVDRLEEWREQVETSKH